MILKLDLSKDHDRNCWIYLKILLIHVVFSLSMVNWIYMVCVTLISFVVSVNEKTSHFLIASRWLCQGSPLSHYICLLVVKGLSRCIIEAQRHWRIQWIKICDNFFLTNSLLFDGILWFSNGYILKGTNLQEILLIYCNGIGMNLNIENSTPSFCDVPERVVQELLNIFPYQLINCLDGFKHLVYKLKPDSYSKAN